MIRRSYYRKMDELLKAYRSMEQTEEAATIVRENSKKISVRAARLAKLSFFTNLVREMLSNSLYM